MRQAYNQQLAGVHLLDGGGHGAGEFGQKWRFTFRLLPKRWINETDPYGV
jgi:hypothetical protein